MDLPHGKHVVLIRVLLWTTLEDLGQDTLDPGSGDGESLPSFVLRLVAAMAHVEPSVGLFAENLDQNLLQQLYRRLRVGDLAHPR